VSWYGFRPYVSVAQKRARGTREIAKRMKKGLAAEPVTLAGRTIARTFWGKAWCHHLESYSDYANRLPRGRAYVRNGSVLHLAVAPGRIDALVQGSDLYEVSVTISELASPRWKGIVSACAGRIDSVIELLQGKFSSGVMQVVTDRDTGLFPAPSQIKLSCSCPDWAGMCKHLAAVLYGVGARLDEQPELLFTLRKVDHLELLSAGTTGAGTKKQPTARTLAADDLADVFGIEMDAGRPPQAPRTKPKKATPPARVAREPRGTKRTAPAGVVPLIDRIVDLLKREKKGLRAEQIRAALGVVPKELSGAIAAALASKRVRKKGVKRATTYFVA
jgi:uncharacterized Zn finger protein